MDLEVFRALRGPAGRALLAEAQTAYDERAAISLATRLRRDHPADLVAAALTQAALRRRARAKFGADADRMFFTRDGLEQATTSGVAAYRAERIAAVLGGEGSSAGGLAGGSTSPAEAARVADLCCGIGGDLLALARAGLAVTGFDRDPLTAEIARANLAEVANLADVVNLADPAGTSGPARAQVEVVDVTGVDRSPYAGVVADPARRSGRGRVFDPADYSPPWSFVTDLLTGTACVKTAPIIPHALVPADVEAEWISEGREVKEAALWSGALRSRAETSGAPVRRRATVLPAAACLTDADDPGEAPVSEPLGFVYEPDGAVIRAGLVTAVAPLVDGSLLHPKIAYLTSDRWVPTPFATAYRVEEVLPYDVKVLKRALRTRDVGALTVKKRGVDVDPDVLRKRLAPRGSTAATLLVTRTAGGSVALLVTPLVSPPVAPPAS
ncbi:SAM-dependent methyltransferase [Actinopolymorpha sp. NPDC004070]|uniref:THUMP-like domain-containing protein n=1 Tax=Actinopolymorpha sp. NPDC004070 TaxID=3154548 RepID=UPI0033B1F177